MSVKHEISPLRPHEEDDEHAQRPHGRGHEVERAGKVVHGGVVDDPHRGYADGRHDGLHQGQHGQNLAHLTLYDAFGQQSSRGGNLWFDQGMAKLHDNPLNGSAVLSKQT